MANLRLQYAQVPDPPCVLLVFEQRVQPLEVSFRHVITQRCKGGAQIDLIAG
ncbi:hypothetical protein D3C76_1821980 [compost metagenome]